MWKHHCSSSFCVENHNFSRLIVDLKTKKRNLVVRQLNWVAKFHLLFVVPLQSINPLKLSNTYTSLWNFFFFFLLQLLSGILLTIGMFFYSHYCLLYLYEVIQKEKLYINTESVKNRNNIFLKHRGSKEFGEIKKPKFNWKKIKVLGKKFEFPICRLQKILKLMESIWKEKKEWVHQEFNKIVTLNMKIVCETYYWSDH